MQGLKDKTIIVTGGGGGIGGATCERLALEGARVAVFDRDLAAAEKTAARITAAGGRALAVACDITLRSQIDAALQTTEAAARECGFVVLGGLTGTGKTELIAALANGLDLEGHANHRGSSFGQRVQGQPTQINFENSLAIELMKQRAQGVARFVVEDEGRHVGACSVPLPLRERLEGAPRVYLTEDFDARVNRIQHDYVVSQLAEFAQRDGEAAGFDAFAHWLRASLLRLSKRLGGARLQTLLAAMEAALAEQRNSGRVDGHRDWIAPLLRDYYDPMYAHQRHLRGDVAAFEGNHAQVLAYLQAHRPD